MVRYARAKGSKASNEKLPEDATPWQVMKKQMLDAQQPKVEPIKNVNEFFKKDNTNESTTWATFEETKQNKKIPKNVKKGTGAESAMKKKKRKQLNGSCKNDINLSESGVWSVVPLKKIKKEEKSQLNDSSLGETGDVSPMSSLKKIKNQKSEQKSTEEKFSGVQESPKGPNFDSPIQEFGEKAIAESKFKRNKNLRKFGNKDCGEKPGFMSHNKRFQDHPRRKPQKDSIIFKLGHKKVELRFYDGYPIKREDWERLTELEKKLREENVPEEQIRATMKLQRRRAEKALANERKKVCFVCREPGHLLSDCPSVGQSQFGKNQDSALPDSKTSGMCYKCGSLEHTHLECKVVEGASFKFARCFVCAEQGHISRQCPDNPRGLYPKGGGCSECGDVTHFRKDCPARVKEKQETALTVQTLKKDDALEALDAGSENTQQIPKTPKQSKKKIVKF